MSKCKNTKRLLHLDRDEELSPDEQRILKMHLKECADCRRLSEKLKLCDPLASIRTLQVPEVENSEFSSQMIMQQVRKMERTKSSHPDRRIGAAVWEQIFSARFRFAVIGAAFAMITAFFIQETVIFNRIASLEEHMRQMASREKIADHNLIKSMDRIRRITGEDRTIKQARVESLIQSIEDDWILIRKKDLRSLINQIAKIKEASELQKLLQQDDLEKLMHQLKPEQHGMTIL